MKRDASAGSFSMSICMRPAWMRQTRPIEVPPVLKPAATMVGGRAVYDPEVIFAA
jgi:hypothetical protein